MAAGNGQPPGGLTEEMRRLIHGHVDHEAKRSAYHGSLSSWWSTYSQRKNEEEDMVADSLLYDERCHLPRTTPGPKAVPEPEVTAAAAAANAAAGAAGDGVGGPAAAAPTSNGH